MYWFPFRYIVNFNNPLRYNAVCPIFFPAHYVTGFLLGAAGLLNPPGSGCPSRGLVPPSRFDPVGTVDCGGCSSSMR